MVTRKNFTTKSAKLRFETTVIIVDKGHPALDPCVDGLKRIRRTTKLFDWYVYASRVSRRRLGRAAL